MTTAAALGAFGWVAQPGHDSFAATDFAGDNITWHQVVAGDLSVQQQQNPYPYEVGTGMLIPGSYKGGFWTAGQLAIQPRLAYAAGVVNGLAPLFWSYAGTRALLAGSASATTATLATSVLGVAAATNNMTGMGFASSDQVMFFPGASGSVQFGYDDGDGDDKWLAFRKVTPGSTNIGETFYNNKISAITLTVGPGAPIRMEVAVMGAAGDHDTYPQVALTTDCATSDSGWNYATANNVDTIPLGCKGFLKVGPASSDPLNNANSLSITLGSNFTPPQQMMVIGQYTPYDYAMLSRPIGITYTHLWENADLYRQIYYGASTGTSWSPQVYTSPIFAHFDSPNGAYKMGFFAQTVDWMARPVTLAGESVVVMQVDGMVRNSTGADWGLWLAHSALSGASAWAT